MKNKGYTTSFLVNESPKQVFDAINNVSGWWSENVKGNTVGLNEVFLYNYKEVHICKIKIIELIANKVVVWHVLENHFNFTQDNKEWKDSKILFEISEQDGKTVLQFTHVGLTPDWECFSVCNDAWTSYIQGSLKNLITMGKGNPNTKEEDLNRELIEKWNLPVK